MFSQTLRSEQIAAIEAVGYVAINYARTATVPLKLLKPDVYCKGKDYKNQKNDITGEIKNEIKILKKFSGKIYLLRNILLVHRLLNRSTDFTHEKKVLR